MLRILFASCLALTFLLSSGCGDGAGGSGAPKVKDSAPPMQPKTPQGGGPTPKPT